MPSLPCPGADACCAALILPRVCAGPGPMGMGPRGPGESAGAGGLAVVGSERRRTAGLRLVWGDVLNVPNMRNVPCADWLSRSVMPYCSPLSDGVFACRCPRALAHLPCTHCSPLLPPVPRCLCRHDGPSPLWRANGWPPRPPSIWRSNGRPPSIRGPYGWASTLRWAWRAPTPTHGWTAHGRAADGRASGWPPWRYGGAAGHGPSR